MPTRLLLIFALLAALAAANPDDKDKPQLPDAPGKALVQKLCGECHGAEIVLGHPHSEEGWAAIVIDMVQRGAQGTDEQFDEVVGYLTKNIKEGAVAVTKLNINKASAKAIETGLGVTPREAQAIVGARIKSPFKTVDDVKKVPGVDAAKIEARKDKLSFE